MPSLRSRDKAPFRNCFSLFIQYTTFHVLWRKGWIAYFEKQYRTRQRNFKHGEKGLLHISGILKKLLWVVSSFKLVLAFYLFYGWECVKGIRRICIYTDINMYICRKGRLESGVGVGGIITHSTTDRQYR